MDLNKLFRALLMSWPLTLLANLGVKIRKAQVDVIFNDVEANSRTV